MKLNPDEIRKFFESLTPDEIKKNNEKNYSEHIRQAAIFREGYKHDFCYLCGKPFKTISHSVPCIHWLLRRCKFKKKDFPRVFQIYSYHNIAAFLRWCANQEKFLSNINDLVEEKDGKKILSYSIRWKNIEWTFDCSISDYSGHPGTGADFPHYHFQMRIDGNPFIDFSDFHIHFTDEDLFNLTAIHEKCLYQDFGSIGAGMQEAINAPLEKVLELASSTENENEATYHFSTMIDASDNPISGEEIWEIQQEANRTGKSFALIAQQRLQGRARVQTVISPAESIPAIASRTKHKK
jgi:hypothetical protein